MDNIQSSHQISVFNNSEVCQNYCYIHENMNLYVLLYKLYKLYKSYKFWEILGMNVLHFCVNALVYKYSLPEWEAFLNLQ